MGHVDVRKRLGHLLASPEPLEGERVRFPCGGQPRQIVYDPVSEEAHSPKIGNELLEAIDCSELDDPANSIDSSDGTEFLKHDSLQEEGPPIKNWWLEYIGQQLVEFILDPDHAVEISSSQHAVLVFPQQSPFLDLSERRVGAPIESGSTINGWLWSRTHVRRRHRGRGG